MPKIAVYKNLVFFLYAYDLAERAHLHVSNNKRGRKRSAKNSCVMKNPEGFVAVEPIIKRVSFARKGFITLYLGDGRILMSPLAKFPSIDALTPLQRRKLSIVDDQLLLFQDTEEIFHLEQFLGREQQYRYKVL